MPALLKRIIGNIVVCLAIYLLPFVLTYGRMDGETLFPQNGGVIHALSTLLLFGYAYLNHYVLVPRYFLQRKYLLYALAVAAGLLLVLWFPQLFRHFEAHEEPPFLRHEGHHGPHGPHGPPGVSPLTYNIILFVVCTFASISIRQQRRLLEVQREKLQTELSFLKAQINPHFLFNTLNSIYALAITKSDDTARAITELSDLMRYILRDSTGDTVPLEKELSYIGNYVAIQRRRLGNTVRIDYEAPERFGNRQVAPLILMSFVENAFKHGINPGEASEIRIRITIDDNRLHLYVINNKVTRVYHEEGMGIGLANAHERLRHYYPARHVLKIEDAPKTFTVDLTLDLND
ncbi:sensor histidine kinase [Flaviaesturariibacter terrae]